jgi:transcriptional regulator with XRE-family HTH domain
MKIKAYMAIKIKTILKKLLHEQDMTAAQLARACKIPPQTINNWLSGQEPRSLDQIKAVADHFKVTVDFLVYGIQEKKKEVIEEFKDEINAGTFEVVLRRIRN